MPLTVDQSKANKNSITIKFSVPVDQASATDLTNYSIFDPQSVDFDQPITLNDAGPSVVQPPTLNAPTNDTLTINFQASGNAKSEFHSGDWVNIVIKNVKGTDGSTLEGNVVAVATQVPGKSRNARLTRDVEDAVSYPILTEDINNRPSSPTGISTSGIGGGSDLGQIASKAVTDILGWKANSADPKGFIGALTQSFTLADVEGHVESTWTPRSYAVQTDLGGGITGAQASLYMRAKDALDKALPLLNGLYPLDPEADPEYVKALREMARSQMTEIVKELGMVGLPSILRIDTYFQILLGQNPGGSTIANSVQFDPDQIQGTLGQLRDTYGIYFQGNPFNNSVEDEQDITNFRVISDYMTSLMQSWISNRSFFLLSPNTPAFFGTQLVLISRQFNVIVETVNEARFALDSVFIGPNERQTLLLEFSDPALPPMFLEDVFDEVEKFATEEGPRLLRDGGKISVTNNILPVVQSLQNMIEQAHDPVNSDVLPDGFRTARVRNSLDDLQDQLQALVNLTEQVEQQVPPPEDKFTISSIIATDANNQYNATGGTLSIIGDGFESDATVEINSATAILASPSGTVPTHFYSAQRIDVVIVDDDIWKSLQSGSHKITVFNSGSSFVSVALPNGITPGKDGIAMSVARRVSGSKLPISSNQAQAPLRGRRIQYEVNGKPVGTGPAAPGYGTNYNPSPAPPPSSPPPSSAYEQKFASLENRHDEINKTLEDIRANHGALTQKLDDAQKNHETLLQRVGGMEESIVKKISDLFKPKKGESKND